MGGGAVGERRELLILPGSGLKIQRERVSVAERVDSERRVLHEELEIKCFYAGEATLAIGNRTLRVRAGDVVVINPYEFHATLDVAKNDPGKYHLFMVPADFLSSTSEGDLDLRAQLLAEGRTFRTLPASTPQLYRLLMRVVRECDGKRPGYLCAVGALMTEALVLLFRRELCESADGGGGTPDRLRVYRLVEPALRHIRDHYAESVSVEELAALCRISKHYFCHVFKDVTRKSAMEYLLDYRLRVADVLLGNSDRSVGEIAEACGFESTAYFCRCFKNHYGVSPGRRRDALPAPLKR